MKITKLKIEGYKNLDLQLEHSSDLIAFIGNNGSGKSNTLEALSIIFSYLYKKDKNIPFNFCLEYTNTLHQKIKIEKSGSTLNSFVDSTSQVDISNYLPKRMIAIYSGEDDRLWKGYYSPHYFSFVEDINKAHNQGTPTPEMPKMLYLNKFYWHISLLSLALSDLPDNQDFLRDILKIQNIDKIKFAFAKESYASYSSSPVLNFIKSIDNQEEYTLAELKQKLDGTTLPATLPMSFGYSPDEVYRLLYLAFSPASSKFVTDIEIIYNGGLTVDDFSEGEKKLLLIKAAFEYASQEDSLFILDEPDAHIHVNNKEQITKSLNPYKGNRQIVITTHSPTLTQSCHDSNLYMIDKGTIVDKTKQDAIEHLTGEFWNKHQQSSFLSSTKPIVLFVEGKHDKIHITNAIRTLKDEYPSLDFDIYNMKGACNIPQIITGLRTSDIKHSTLFIGIFDNDEEGMNSCNKSQVGFIGKKGKDNSAKFVENSKKGYISLCYPKPSGYTANDLTVENLFASEEYEKAYKEVLSQHSFDNKSIDDSSKDIKEKAKTKLSHYSETFSKEDFKYFRPLFDRINEIWNHYHKEEFVVKDTKEELHKEVPNKASVSGISPKDTFKKQKEFVDNNETDDVLMLAQNEAENLLKGKLYYEKFHIASKGIYAESHYYPEKKVMVLLKGAKVVKESTTSILVSTIKLRNNAQASNLLKEDGDYYTLTESISFNTPSPAASFVLGRNSNGWNEWKDAKGKTLNDLYRKNKTK